MHMSVLRQSINNFVTTLMQHELLWVSIDDIPEPVLSEQVCGLVVQQCLRARTDHALDTRTNQIAG